MNTSDARIATILSIHVSSRRWHLRVEHMRLLRCCFHPAAVMLLLGHRDENEAVLSLALFGDTDKRTLRRWRDTQNAFDSSGDELQKLAFVNCLSHTLCTGTPRRFRTRGPRVYAGVHRALRSQSAQMLAQRWPVLEYIADESHALIDARVQVHWSVADLHAATQDGTNMASEEQLYAECKKRPQICVMCALVLRQLQSFLPTCESPSTLCDSAAQLGCVIVDIGGGRGDLALNLARLLQQSYVLVMDRNSRSLETGKRKAEELNLLSRMAFLCEPIEGAARTLEEFVRTARQRIAGHEHESVPVVVVALHACGGLTDAVMEICYMQQWPFVCCTCCYASNRQLRRWTRACGAIQGTEHSTDDVFVHLGAAAETQHYPAQDRAAHLVNSMRCEAFSTGCYTEVTHSLLPPGIILDLLGECCAEAHETSQRADREYVPVMHTWDLQLLQYPKKWSDRSTVILGRPLILPLTEGQTFS
jgi:hypothetical protein